MKKFIRSNIIPLIIITLLCCMTAGYAIYYETISLNGDIIIKKSGIIEITNAVIVENECSNISNYTNPTYEGMKINFSVTGRSENFSATYLIEITNNSFYDYTFTDFAFNPTIAGSENTAKITTTITNANTGESIGAGNSFPKNSVITLKVKINFETENPNTTVGVTGNGAMTENNTGTLEANITPTSGNLQGKDAISCFTLNVMNSYHYTRTFNLTSSNENIKFVDNKRNEISVFTINAGSTSSYEVCTMVKEGSIFLTDSTTTTPYISSNGINNLTLDTLTFAVDIDINATDKEIPQVGNVTLAMADTNTVAGEAFLNWTRIDSGGSPITNYHIILYNETTGAQTKLSTGNAIPSYTFNNLSEGTYYAKVYAEDEAGNIGSNYVDSATTANGYCSRSQSVALKWLYNVDTSGFSRLASDGATTAVINNSYEATISVTASSSYSLPDDLEITMAGQQLTNGNEYTFNSSSGKLIITKVTGDITISGSATFYCLIKGTKIRLADNTYKNIEDIKYDDLLTVYNHELGGITYEYPIWIEKETKVNNYQKTTFSDGTILKTFGDHGVFSMDALKYVSVADSQNFHIGTKVAKINEDGSISIVLVEKIEIVNEKTSYYNVSSTRYHNIIAENLLTTDGSILSSNVFSFDDNITWTDERDEFLKSNDLFVYEQFRFIFPKFNFPEHIFRGYRMEEMKHLYNQGLLDINMYYDNLKNLGTDTMKDIDGTNLWMVTTSEDKVINKKDFLRKQGSYYTLPHPKNKENFIGWYNTSDGKMYNPTDKVKIVYGMHFIAKYN